MANRYYSDANPNKSKNGPGTDAGIRPTQRDSSKVKVGKPVQHGGAADGPSFTAHPDNVKKEGMGLGNKASSKQKGGQATRGY